MHTQFSDIMDALAPLSNRTLMYVKEPLGSRDDVRLIFSMCTVLLLPVRPEGNNIPKAMGTKSSGRGFLFLLVLGWLARRERRDSY